MDVRIKLARAGLKWLDRATRTIRWGFKYFFNSWQQVPLASHAVSDASSARARPYSGRSSTPYIKIDVGTPLSGNLTDLIGIAIDGTLQARCGWIDIGQRTMLFAPVVSSAAVTVL